MCNFTPLFSFVKRQTDTKYFSIDVWTSKGRLLWYSILSFFLSTFQSKNQIFTNGYLILFQALVINLVEK